MAGSVAKLPRSVVGVGVLHPFLATLAAGGGNLRVPLPAVSLSIREPWLDQGRMAILLGPPGPRVAAQIEELRATVRRVQKQLDELKASGQRALEALGFESEDEDEDDDEDEDEDEEAEQD